MPRGARRLPAGCVERLSGADLIVHAGDISEPCGAGRARGARPAGLRGARQRRRAGAARAAAGRAGARRWTAPAWRWSTTPGPAKGRLERMRRRFPEADAVVFGHSHLPLHEEGGRVPDLQPGQPDRAPPRPAPHDGAGRGGRRRGPCSASSNWTRFAAPWTSTSSSSAPPAPCPPRAARLPATLVRRGGERLLFDCGEGTQRQLTRSVGLVELEDVFITHFHADHVLGLPGMVKTFNLRGARAPAHRPRPAGARAAVPDLRPADRANRLRAAPGGARPRRGAASATATGSPPSTSTTACRAQGYALLEDSRPGRFDEARARELGVEPGPDFGRLQQGETVGGGDPRPGARRGARAGASW